MNESRTDDEKSPGKKHRAKTIAITILAVLAVSAFIVVFFLPKSFLIKPLAMSSGSMLPTINLQDRIIVDRFIYRVNDIQRGDIIAFTSPSESSGAPYIKRVIALAGDTVEINDGKVIVNGMVFEVPGAAEPDYKLGPITIPADKLFVLGDNRNESADSHIWGPIAQDSVIGRVDMVYWPIQDIGMLN